MKYGCVPTRAMFCEMTEVCSWVSSSCSSFMLVGRRTCPYTQTHYEHSEYIYNCAISP